MLDFIFDGKKASDYGIKLREAMSISPAEPYVESVHVPGRNGDLHIFDGSYKNRTITAKCFVLADNATSAMVSINKFLFYNFDTGYKNLILSDDEAHYWEAQIVNGGEIAARLNKLNPFEIVWTCKPFRVNIDSGDYEL